MRRSHGHRPVRGDPRVERKGPSSSTDADRLARALGWFSVGLGVAAFAGVDAVHRRRPGRGRDDSDRVGLPRGAQASRGLARRDVPTPPDHLAEGTVAAALPAT
ncbi:hypothetical protein D3273_23660 [Lichenibacterium minor]|uniref:Uncharacterized protein n=1 Tax=Lichenibacterium minor TaxID=2316528 RepID=A0A4Q2TZR0_9HYPH|nr:hypothetical protein D3273_23660 [Lichenibacterium minor]